jgi:biopolymer transport protein ExbD
MKLITYRALIILFAIGLCADVLAEEKKEYPHISFVGPGGGKDPVSRDQFVILVIEGPFISYDTNPIPSAGVVEYVNNLLKVKNVSYIGVHTREGIKYGDVVRAIDTLRKTNAKEVGVSMIELPVGREP